jgi:tRNA A-37 threonylcarbamoyl transferase component Bud32
MMASSTSGIAVSAPIEPENAPQARLSDLAGVDVIAERFDAGWDSSRPSPFASCLREAPAHLRPRLAVELACVDLERRFRQGLPVDLAGYADAMPELRDAGPDALRELEAHYNRLLAQQATRPQPATPVGGEALPSHIGRYSVIRRIDAGGQATTYLGVHSGLGQTVVLKWLNEALARDAGHVERLAREGRLLAGLDHPNIVRVLDLDVHEGRPFLAMEYVEGRTLERYALEERPGPEEAARVVAALARAAAHAHARGITHQDIKPRNALIDKEGRPRLIDFGLAWYCPAWAQGGDPLNTASGTPQYLSPEQARGQADAIGPATDVFGLGGVLYFLLTGRPLYAGGTVRETLHLAAEVAYDRAALERPRVPGRLRRLCLRALAADPAARPTARELAESLTARPARRWLVAALTVLVLGGLAAGVWALFRERAQDTGDDASAPGQQRGADAGAVAKPLRVNPLRVMHYATVGQEEDGRGRIGDKSFATKVGDAVTVTVELSEPGYFYLIGFNFDGTVQLLWPADDKGNPLEATKPRRQQRLRFPEGDGRLTLDASDKGGLQAFVVTASPWPLPAFAEWRKGRVGERWAALPAGQKVYEADPRGAWPRTAGLETDRGNTVRPAAGMPPLAELCRSLSEDGMVVEAIAFPVHPAEGKR